MTVSDIQIRNSSGDLESIFPISVAHGGTGDATGKLATFNLIHHPYPLRNAGNVEDTPNNWNKYAGSTLFTSYEDPSNIDNCPTGGTSIPMIFGVQGLQALWTTPAVSGAPDIYYRCAIGASNFSDWGKIITSNDVYTVTKDTSFYWKVIKIGSACLCMNQATRTYTGSSSRYKTCSVTLPVTFTNNPMVQVTLTNRGTNTIDHEVACDVYSLGTSSIKLKIKATSSSSSLGSSTASFSCGTNIFVFGSIS